jgi:hypothetical protein
MTNYRFLPWRCVGETRRRTSERTWRKVETWNRAAACNCGVALGKGHMEAFATCPQCSGNRPRVEIGVDVFEDWGGIVQDGRGNPLFGSQKPSGSHAVRLADVRRDLFSLIDRCQNLQFVLRTEWPENVRGTVPHRLAIGVGGSQNVIQRRDNVILLLTANDQATFDAGWPKMLACSDLTPVVGVAFEPLLGPVTLHEALISKKGFFRDVPQLECCGKIYQKLRGVDLVTIAGESGRHARPCDVKWIRSLAGQCREAGVACVVDRLGANCVDPAAALGRGNWPDGMRINAVTGFVEIHDPNGGDPSEWPEDLREFAKWPGVS